MLPMNSALRAETYPIECASRATTPNNTRIAFPFCFDSKPPCALGNWSILEFILGRSCGAHPVSSSPSQPLRKRFPVLILYCRRKATAMLCIAATAPPESRVPSPETTSFRDRCRGKVPKVRTSRPGRCRAQGLRATSAPDLVIQADVVADVADMRAALRAKRRVHSLLFGVTYVGTIIQGECYVPRFSL